MSTTFTIPADLADSDLQIKELKQIVEIRSIAKAAQSTLDGPGEKAIRTAKARLVWAKDAEEAVVNGKAVPPKVEKGGADAEDYLGDD